MISNVVYLFSIVVALRVAHSSVVARLRPHSGDESARVGGLGRLAGMSAEEAVMGFILSTG